MKKLLNATISEELIEQLRNNSTRGKFSEYTEEVIRAGLKAINEQPSTVDECIEKLIRAYKKEKQNKAHVIEQKEEQIQEPIIEQDEYKPIKDFLYKRYMELRDEFDDTVPLSQQDVIEVFDNKKKEIWDIDNKTIKPIIDGLVASKVIEDDSISKMFYCVKGYYDKKPHTEVTIFEAKKFMKWIRKQLGK